MRGWATATEEARRITAGVTRILPPCDVIAGFRALAAAGPAVARDVLGHDAAGAPIEAYRWGRGATPVLLYGFPDPGEALGATALLALFEALAAGRTPLARLDATWHAIPCLNLVDQPDGGRSLAPVMKTAAQEVDWCVHDPRPETAALLALAGRARPRVVFPLHDEYHCREVLPAYAMASEVLAAAACDDVREAFRAFGYAVDADTADPAMGAGLALMGGAADYANSTFAAMARDGLVFIPELSDRPDLQACELAAAPLAACLAVLAHRLPVAAAPPA